VRERVSESDTEKERKRDRDRDRDRVRGDDIGPRTDDHPREDVDGEHKEIRHSEKMSTVNIRKSIL
jgi:hypothetical protein